MFAYIWWISRFLKHCVLKFFYIGGFSSSGGQYLFQNQCFCHSRCISSMGTCFVSGKRKKMKQLMMKIKEANRRKIPYLRWQSEVRKSWATAAVKIMFTHTTILWPADLVSRGKISVGTNQPRGPHDLPYPSTNKKITITRKILIPFDSSSPCPNFSARVTPTATCNGRPTSFISISWSNKQEKRKTKQWKIKTLLPSRKSFHNQLPERRLFCQTCQQEPLKLR